MPRPEAGMRPLAALVAVLVAACGGSEAPAPRYETAAVERGDLSVTVEASGTIEPVAAVEVKSKASGEILELNAEIGDTVKAGALLVRIDPRTPQNLVDQAQAELNAALQRERTAVTQLERGDKLRKEAWINDAELEALQLEVANTRAAAVAARVALENARIGLEDTEVRAPSSGTILTRLVERGQVISSPTRDVGGGTVILTMADLTRVRARVRVDETDIGKLAAGVPARIHVAAYPGREFGGSIEKIEPQAIVDQNVTMFAVLINVANDDGLLRPGMNVDAVFDAAGRSGVLTLPVMALRAARDVDATAEILGLDPGELRKAIGAPAGPGRTRGPGERSGALGLGRGLWVVAIDDGREVPTPVETGITDLDRVEIVHGLAEGDEVLLLPTASLVEIQQQIQDVASRRGGIPGLTQPPAPGAQPPPAAPRSR
ncbi:MAG TPA: efflux RND transporter periplasmic adaptor subunit [Steroidobacteraceae bacterium]|nr:efflux RND transporter periplasmic adaptor subunit [Steroidobacteraceae bacterium]